MIKINSPKFDSRKFYGSKLNNGIKYIIVNDSHLKKSFVTVSVNIGSYSNPEGYDGLAHFLEHMLFMGSKKFPKENHYNERLNQLGGSSNAYTDVMETVYYFNVFDEGLNEIMDIFSRFFIDPLFDPDSVNREINAVDSEHKKNIHKDFWKKFQLMLYLTNSDSNTNQFITGSLNTLNRLDIREKVIEFYNKYYIPENISICVGSSQPVEEIEKMIANTFGYIPKSSHHNKLVITKPFYSNNMNKFYHLKSLSTIYELLFIWEIPSQEKYMRTKEFLIFDKVLRNESTNSLFFYLKNLGYINSIRSEIKYEGMYIITFNLSKEGFNNIDLIQKVLFDCIEQIKKLDIKKYAEYYKKLLEVNFDCIDKFQTEDLCNLLAVNHHYEETQLSYETSFKISSLKNTNEYISLYDQFLTPNNVIKILVSSNHPNETQFEYHQLKEYEATYAEIPILVSRNVTVDKSFCCFDIENPYININPSIIENLDQFDEPALIGTRQWYGGCSKFSEPLLNIWLQFNNSNYFSSSKNYLLSHISCSVLNFLSSVILYKPLELCYSISFIPRPSTSSININIKGVNDIEKLQLLIKDINQFMKNINEHFIKLSEDYITNLLVSLSDAYSNIKFNNSWEYVSYKIKNYSLKTEFDYLELIKEIKNINYNTIKDYLSNIVQKSSLTSLVYGNIKSNNVKNLFVIFNDLYLNNITPLPKINELEDFELVHPNIKEKANCVSYLYPIGTFIPREYILLSLTANILRQSFFDILRTKNQLGYLVSMGSTNIRNFNFIIQKIQSDKPVDFIEEKIGEFNKTIRKQIQEAEFEKFVATLKNELEEPEYSLEEKIDKYLPEISLREYLFNRNELLLDQLKKITRQDLLDFVDRNINEQNRKRFIINGN
jgi:insulysin